MEVNNSIGCTVHQCKYNAVSQNYCTLKKIMVGTHEANPTMDQCTDCKSFELKRQFSKSILHKKNPELRL